jgi:hypothetical protein
MTAVEFWLPIGAIAFYLYDSAQLLWHNELLFVRAGRRWRVEGPSTISLSGRRVYLPNPLLPQRPGFKIHWSLAEERAAPAALPDEFLRALKPIGVVALLLAWMLVLLPLVSWTLGTSLALLLLFAAYYLFVLVALGFMLWRRRALQLSGGACASLVFDALACAPFAVNLARKIALRRGLDGDPLLFAGQHFDPAGRAMLRGQLLRKLEEQQAGETPSPEQSAQIAQQLRKLGDCPP